jgi:hypothetical protein
LTSGPGTAAGGAGGGAGDGTGAGADDAGADDAGADGAGGGAGGGTGIPHILKSQHPFGGRSCLIVPPVRVLFVESPKKESDCILSTKPHTHIE